MAKQPRLPRNQRKKNAQRKLNAEGAPRPDRRAARKALNDVLAQKRREYNEAKKPRLIGLTPEAEQEHGHSLSSPSQDIIEASEQLAVNVPDGGEDDIDRLTLTQDEIDSLMDEFPALNPNVRWKYEPHNYELAPGEQDEGNGLQVHEYEIVLTDGRTIKGKANYYGKHKSLISVILGINRDIDTGDMEEIIVGDYEYVFD